LHSFPCIPKEVVGPSRSPEQVRHVKDAERPSLVPEDVEGVPKNKPENHPFDVDSESIDLEKFTIDKFQCYRPTTVAV